MISILNWRISLRSEELRSLWSNLCKHLRYTILRNLSSSNLRKHLWRINKTIINYLWTRISRLRIFDHKMNIKSIKCPRMNRLKCSIGRQLWNNVGRRCPGIDSRYSGINIMDTLIGILYTRLSNQRSLDTNERTSILTLSFIRCFNSHQYWVLTRLVLRYLVIVNIHHLGREIGRNSPRRSNRIPTNSRI